MAYPSRGCLPSHQFSRFVGAMSFRDLHGATTVAPASATSISSAAASTLSTTCAPCLTAAPQTLMLSIATSLDYLRQVEALAESAASVGYKCVCAAASSRLSKQSSSARVRVLHMDRSSTWRPPRLWCSQSLSGWRHAGVLKMHALAVATSLGWHVLLVDADWRLVADPLPALLATRRDVIGARDQTRHMLNVGALLVRSTPEVVRVSRRILNRTLVAWDQAVFTEEMSGSSASCCWTDLGRKPYLAHAAVSREAKLKTRGQYQQCSATRDYLGGSRQGADTLSPPTTNREGLPKRPMYPRWRRAGYNTLDRAWYRFKCFECDGKCTREKCELDAMANGGSSVG